MKKQGIIKELNEAGISDLNVNYKGWFNRDYSYKAPNKVKLINELGSKKILKIW